MVKVDQDVLIYNQIDTIYDHEEILNISNKNIDIFKFCEVLGINQYKSVGNINYTVLKTTKGLFLVLFDGDITHATIQQIRFSSITNQNSFDNLKVGMTLGNARTADPDGQYEFLLHSSQNYPRISYHYFENGDCFSVKYEGDIIVEIAHFTL